MSYISYRFGRNYIFHHIIFTTAITQEGNDGQIACYVPLNPLDISSDWTCTVCKHIIGPARIRELEEIAQKIVFSGRYSLNTLDSSH